MILERTASQTLIDTLEAFGECEGRTIVIVFTDIQGDAKQLEWLEVAKHMILSKERAI